MSAPASPSGPVAGSPPVVLSGIVLVTGTGTDIGKTMVTAALAGAALAAGHRVAVVKPVQTGVGPGEPGDIAEIVRLLGLPPGPGSGSGSRFSSHEFFRLPEPMAPQAAARRAGATLPALAEQADRIAALAGDHDLVLVEGAGGLLVRLDEEGNTLADLAGLLPLTPQTLAAGIGAVVVTGVELGTLNVTELTVEALRHRDITVHGLVIGRWPATPGTIEIENRSDLPRLTGVPLLGLLPEGPPLPPVLQPVMQSVP